MFKEISIKDITEVSIGQVEDPKAGTGCTVILSKEGMHAGLDVRGGGPASRESELIKPLASQKNINAVVLSGGSAFGLDASGGVMQYLEEQGIGYDVIVTKVPLVCQASLFDLTVGDSFVRPDKKMGYEAAKAALENPNYQDGNYGAGCGATVGKFFGLSRAMKSGIGSYAVQIGNLKIGAIAAVNSFGDIFDYKTGKKIAGLLSEDKKGFSDTLEYMTKAADPLEKAFTGNTTLGVVITNASFSTAQLTRIVGIANDGYARAIKPVHTSADGDSIFAVSAGNVEASLDLVGSLGAEVMSEAIKCAVLSSKSAYGCPAACDL